MRPTVAVVGASCLFPGASNLSEFWSIVESCNPQFREMNSHRFGMSPAILKGSKGETDSLYSLYAAYIENAREVKVQTLEDSIVSRLDKLDPFFLWVYYLMEQSLLDCNARENQELLSRTGLILSNLTFPLEGAQESAEDLLLDGICSPLGKERVASQHSALNSHQSALPAQMASHDFGLGLDSYALDAACASGLYAIELACQTLIRKEARMMMAMGVNRCEMAAVQVGFSQLGAYSQGEACLPFDANGDGLLVGEGGGCVALKLLDDAIADGDKIYCLIRGGGLSCDGKDGGLLAPSHPGQKRALEQVYFEQGIDPATVDFVECHGTATKVGDATELKTLESIFNKGRTKPLGIGSVKSIFGHCLSAAGMASFLKMMLSIVHKKSAPTHFSFESEAIVQNQDWVYLVGESKPWESEGVRRAAMNGFGFGGTNAHVLIEEYSAQHVPEPHSSYSEGDVAIVAAEIELGSLRSLEDLRVWLRDQKSLLQDLQLERYPEWIAQGFPELSQLLGNPLTDREISIGEYRMSPREIERLLPQQLLMLELSKRALDQVSDSSLNKERTGVLVGMNWNANISEHTTRLKAHRAIEKLLQRLQKECTAEEFNSLVEEYQNSICPEVNSDDVVGDIPNFPANRINVEFDFQGPSFVVFGEEGSSIKALQLAIQMLNQNKADSMVVGAVDLPLDFRVILSEFEAAKSRPFAEGGVILVLKRYDDALKSGENIVARVKMPQLESAQLDQEDSKTKKPLFREASNSDFDISTKLGYSRSAHGLVQILASALCVGDAFDPLSLSPCPTNRAEESLFAEVSTPLGMGKTATTVVQRVPQQDREQKVSLIGSDYQLFTVPGKNRAEIIEKLNSGSFSDPEPNSPCLGIACYPGFSLEEARRRALDWMGKHPVVRDPKGIYFTDTPKSTTGKLALVYPGFGNLYPSMGQELLSYMPSLLNRLEEKTKYSRTLSCKNVLWDQKDPDLYDMSVFEISFVTTYFQCFLTDLVVNQLGVKADSLLGFSGGEINSLSALNIWTMDDYYEKACHDEVFSRHAAGEFLALRKYLGTGLDEELNWNTYLIQASESDLIPYLEGQGRVYLLMRNSPKECMVGGVNPAIQVWIDSLPFDTQQIPIPQVYHSDVLKSCEAELRELWSNEVQPVEGLDVYSHARGVSYELTRDSVSEAITRTCIEKVDFEPMVQTAFKDGVRVFLELGPQASVLRHIENILPRDQIATISLNVRQKSEREQLLQGLAHLASEGISFRSEMFRQSYDRNVEQKEKSKKFRTILPVGRFFQSSSKSNLVKMLELLPDAMNVEVDDRSKEQAAEAKVDLLPVKASLGMPGKGMQVPKRKYRNYQGARPMSNGQRDNQDSNSYLQIQNRIAQLHQQFLEEQTHLLQVEQAVFYDEEYPAERMSSTSSQWATQELQSAQVNQFSTDIHPNSEQGPFYPNPEFLSHLRQDLKMEQRPPYHGPKPLFDRGDCLNFAHGKISDVFGPEFDVVDGFRYRTRYPSPPYLLVDRIMEIDGKLHEFKPSTVVTEFDVSPNDWFLVDGRVPISVCIESGQADLFLICYVGIDHKVQGDRVYRLLGADFTFFDDYPQAPCTLRYEIKINSYVNHEGTWLFFFEGVGYSNGKKFIQWVNGCAGYFTMEELLAKGSTDIPGFEVPQIDEPYLPVRYCTKETFGPQELQALGEGRVYDCFGPGFEVPFPAAQGRMRTFPQWTNKDLRVVDQIRVDRKGGKFAQGYLEADLALDDDHWYFKSHFVGDNVMPGTLMLDGCSQVLEFYLLYLGLGFQERGGRFQPVPGEEIKVKCRGQVIPGMKNLNYYLHVQRVEPGSRPRVYAEGMILSDEKEVVHFENLAFEIIYDALPALPEVGEQAYDKFGRPVHTNEAQLIELTIGKPSTYFGEHYHIFDYKRQISRMPNPPYACITRVMEVEGEVRKVKPGIRMVNEFDMSADDWYFQVNQGLMPFCVLNEVVLQPCGLLPQLLELEQLSDSDRFIRNLGGKMVTLVDLPATDNRIIAEVILKEVVDTPGTFMVKFDGKYWLPDGTLIAEGKDLHFGFFSQEALLASPGLSREVKEEETRSQNNQSSALISSAELPAPDSFSGHLALPQWPCQFFDRIVEYRPTGGRFGNGYILAHKDVDPTEWIFYSHFYRDPVVPGSYSLDAVTQLSRYALLLDPRSQEMGNSSYFQVNQRQWMDWQYRGQILQHNKTIEYELDIESIEECDTGLFALTHARVFADGKYIYKVNNIRVDILNATS